MQLTRRDALKSLAGLVGAPPRKKKAGPSVSDTSPPTDRPVTKSASTGDFGVFAKYGVTVKDRSVWVPPGLGAPVGLKAEPDVRVLLVHHSDSPNTYRIGEVPSVLRGFRSYHTGKDKGWADIAYNFFVDRFGEVWEGRAGSLRGPVIGSATGGNQGHSQLVCLVGNHAEEPPSRAALDSLARLLAALSDRYGLSLNPESTTSFVSLGSNRWPAGKTVTTRSIEGHRAMSMTTCPGDAAFEALPTIRLAVEALRRQ